MSVATAAFIAGSLGAQEPEGNQHLWYSNRVALDVGFSYAG